MSASLINGTLRYALGELANLPRAAVVVEDRYSQVFTQHYVRPAQVADGLAELQIRWPTIPIVFCETRKLAEEFTYRYLAAAHTWATEEPTAITRTTGPITDGPTTGGPILAGPSTIGPSPAQIRTWARQHGLTVPDRGRLPPQVHQAWRNAHPTEHPN